ARARLRRKKMSRGMREMAGRPNPSCEARQVIRTADPLSRDVLCSVSHSPGVAPERPEDDANTILQSAWDAPAADMMNSGRAPVKVSRKSEISGRKPRPHLAAQRPGRILRPRLGDDADDRLGVARPDVDPAVLPVQAQAVLAVNTNPRPARFQDAVQLRQA